MRSDARAEAEPAAIRTRPRCTDDFGTGCSGGDGAAASARPAIAEPDAPRSPGPLARVMRRDEYMGPGTTTGKPPSLDDLRPDRAAAAASRQARRRDRARR